MIQGTWQVVSALIDGKLLDQETTDIITTDKLVRKTKPGSVERRMKLDPSKTPMWIDLTITPGPDDGKTMARIYELDRDDLKICRAPPGQNRPTEFASSPGSDRVLATLKRAIA